MIDVRIAATITDAAIKATEDGSQMVVEGKMDELRADPLTGQSLRKVYSITENATEIVEAVEYLLVVHRSVHVIKKAGAFAGTEAGNFGG